MKIKSVQSLNVLRKNIKKFSAVLIVILSSSFHSGLFAADWKTPRTADGYPDLQGFWTNATITPLERETVYGKRGNLTSQEVAELEGADADFREEQNKPTDPSLTVEDLPKDCGGGFTGVNCGYNSFWVDPGTKIMVVDGEHRNSIITSTDNGRVPPLTAEGRGRITKLMSRYMNNQSEGPEARALGERCILSFGSSAGPPMIPLLYNNNYQIVQNKDYVMILVEMVHDARIVRLNSEHRPDNMKHWMGDTVGHYEGDTLVIETVGLRPEQSFRGSGPNVKITERFTRTAVDKIKYEFTIDDSENFVEAWGGEVAFNKSNKPLYEYACHEGNYALPGILAGARRAEELKKESK